ncbi:RNA-guided pseudouridylation complex pseudouridine synthase subunit Cbf5 [Candidatus Pacearchaeota archaeon]|nr:RNA-guided pseudouridylation complex pseudouridine synthase subunit Cbf5 [Candidatus Pacearchaeota archaeon]
MDIDSIKKGKTISELLEFGIVNIDKPTNPTSFDVSDFVRKRLGLRKTSHFGTLDPKVTGVLPIALNRACKLTGFFLGEDKEYVGIMRIHEEISLEKIRKAINEKFLGKIKQTPPKKSRVKRQEREREIKNFEILEQDGKNFIFLAEVQGGTYIRKLIDDLGKYLNVGAHMLELRRIRAGIFKEENSVNLYDFEKAVEEYKKGNEKLLREIIIPGEIIGEIYPVVHVNEKTIGNLLTGKPIYKKDLKDIVKMEIDKIISVFCGERFIGMYKVVNDGEIFAKAEFVMQEIKRGDTPTHCPRGE